MKILSVFLRTSFSQAGWLIFLARFALGSFFFASGYKKAFDPEGQALMLETITEAGIFYPKVMAVFVSYSEVIFGLFLAVGLLSRLSSLVLFVISFVALLTVAIHQIPAGINALAWYSWLFYLPESGYMVMSLQVFIIGGGRLAIDNVVYKRLVGNS